MVPVHEAGKQRGGCLPYLGAAMLRKAKLASCVDGIAQVLNLSLWYEHGLGRVYHQPKQTKDVPQQADASNGAVVRHVAHKQYVIKVDEDVVLVSSQ